MDFKNILAKHTMNVGLTENAVIAAMEECFRTKHTQERILCAAVRCIMSFSNREWIISGYRHKQCYQISEKLCGYTAEMIQEKDKGFLTSHNRFVNRAEAYTIALKANQLILGDTPGCIKELISENLYYHNTEIEEII